MAAGLFAAAFTLPTAAYADITQTLISTGTLPASGNPYGTVVISEVNANEILYTVTLSGTNHFASTGQAGAFAFDLAGFSTIGVSGLPATWTLNSTTAGSLHMDGAGFFDYAVNFSNGGNTDGSSLSFDVTATGIGTALLNGTLNQSNTFVSADICTQAPNANNNCPTGALTGFTFVPAPVLGAGLPGLLTACLGLIGLARRRRRLAI